MTRRRQRLPVGRVLEEMERAKDKAIRRAKRYDTLPPRFIRQLKWGVNREPASPYRVLADYVEAVEWEFLDRISNELLPKKQRKLLKQCKKIIRPCTLYFSAAAMIVTRTIRDMGDHIKKERGKHWFDIRKLNARMIKWDVRCWYREKDYTDEDIELAVRDCHEISDALNGKLPEGMDDFERIVHRYNRIHPLPDYWWRWWNMEEEQEKYYRQIMSRDYTKIEKEEDEKDRQMQADIERMRELND